MLAKTKCWGTRWADKDEQLPVSYTKDGTPFYYSRYGPTEEELSASIEMMAQQHAQLTRLVDEGPKA